ncbi:MAG: peptidylprolyl isomerase [Candidatus Pelagibacter bacterium]|nr:peptidylprolyl isomerase [Candidatus Pelagibacter bacterium]
MILKNIKIFFFLVFFLDFSELVGLENKIIIKVNNKIITSYELKNKILSTLFLSNEELNQENINKTKALVARSLIDLKLKENEVEKYKIEISENEVFLNLNSIANKNLENLKTKFKNNNIDFEVYKNNLKTELSWRKLIFFLYNKKIELNESEIDLELKKILKDNKNNFEFELSELQISFKDQNDKNKIKDLINKEINEKGFENTVLKYSESLSKNSQGNLGWVNAKSLSKKIFDEIKDLQINETSDPIVTGNTLLFLKINAKREVNLNNENYDVLKKKIIESKKNQLFSMYSNSHLSKIRNQSKVEYK